MVLLERVTDYTSLIHPGELTTSFSDHLMSVSDRFPLLSPRLHQVTTPRLHEHARRNRTPVSIDQVEDCLYQDGSWFFRVRYRGEESRWEPETQLGGVSDELRERICYLKKHAQFAIEGIEQVAFQESESVWYYFIKWLGYGPEESTWEPEANVLDRELIWSAKSKSLGSWFNSVIFQSSEEFGGCGVELLEGERASFE